MFIIISFLACQTLGIVGSQMETIFFLEQVYSQI